MAVDPGLQKSGVGGALIAAMIDEVRARGGVRLWCNARTSAVGFYLRHGLSQTGAEFEVKGVGPHSVMQRSIS
jgi:phosphoribosylformimino-5-aminoimidazole carboxamide ribotide isomerase